MCYLLTLDQTDLSAVPVEYAYFTSAEGYNPPTHTHTQRGYLLAVEGDL